MLKTSGHLISPSEFGIVRGFTGTSFVSFLRVFCRRRAFTARPNPVYDCLDSAWTAGTWVGFERVFAAVETFSGEMERFIIAVECRFGGLLISVAFFRFVEQMETLIDRRAFFLLSFQDFSERGDDNSLIIERILILIRNVLYVPTDPFVERRTDSDANVHDQVSSRNVWD